MNTHGRPSVSSTPAFGARNVPVVIQSRVLITPAAARPPRPIRTPKLQPPTTSATRWTPTSTRAAPTSPTTATATGRSRLGITTIAITMAEAATALCPEMNPSPVPSPSRTTMSGRYVRGRSLIDKSLHPLRRDPCEHAGADDERAQQPVALDDHDGDCHEERTTERSDLHDGIQRRCRARSARSLIHSVSRNSHTGTGRWIATIHDTANVTAAVTATAPGCSSSSR